MTLVTKALSYEEIPMGRVNGGRVAAKLAKNGLAQLSTLEILQLVFERHKYFIVCSALVLENVYLVLHFFTVV